jgi:hypothetical protein
MSLVATIYVFKPRNRESSVCVATGYGMHGRDSNPGRGKNFLLHNVQNGFGAHPAS